MEEYDPYEAAAEAAHDEWIADISQEEHDEMFFIPADIDTREWDGEDE